MGRLPSRWCLCIPELNCSWKQGVKRGGDTGLMQCSGPTVLH